MATSSLWARAQAGETFHAGSRLVDDAVVTDIVRAGGFAHPLFVDPEYARSRGFSSAPLPGQALLVLIGGCLEVSGRFEDGVIALLGYREVTLTRRVCSGDVVDVDVELIGVETSEVPDSGVVVARLFASVAGEVACSAVALHLVEVDPSEQLH
jgi:acyl dehydratase